MKKASNKKPIVASFLDVIFNFIALGFSIYFGLMALKKIITNHPNINSSIILIIIVFTAGYLLYNVLKGFISRFKILESIDVVEDCESHIIDIINSLNKSINQQNSNIDSIRADNFFINKKDACEEEKLETIIQSNPKLLQFSGGEMKNLFSDLSENEEILTNFAKRPDVKIQFLFPDPNNDYIMEYLSIYVTNNRHPKSIYVEKVRANIRTLKKIINKNNLNDKIEIRYYDSVPSFGLQVISETDDNNDRLYIDLHTICINMEERYIIKINKSNSINSYNDFSNQFNKLWDISNDSTKDSNFRAFRKYIISIISNLKMKKEV